MLLVLNQKVPDNLGFGTNVSLAVGQTIRPPYSHNYAAIIGFPMSRSMTPDSPCDAKALSFCTAPIGQESPTLKKANFSDSKSLTSISVGMNESIKLSAVLSCLRLSEDGSSHGENEQEIDLSIAQEFKLASKQSQPNYEELKKWKHANMYSVDFLFEMDVDVRHLLYPFERGKKKQMEEKFCAKNILGQGGFRRDAFQKEVEKCLLVYSFMPKLSIANSPRQNKSEAFILVLKTSKRMALGASTGLEYLLEYCNPMNIPQNVKVANILLGYEPVILNFAIGVGIIVNFSLAMDGIAVATLRMFSTICSAVSVSSALFGAPVTGASISAIGMFIPKVFMVLINVIKTGPDRPVRPVEPQTG